MSCVRVFLVLGTLVLSGCGDQPPLSRQGQADASTQSACRERAEAVYDQQNRGQIYSPSAASQMNTPFSASYVPVQADRGLSQIFAHDQMISDCVRNSGTGAERSQPPPVAPSVVPKPH
jgi:hypothetical protein